MEAFSFAGAQAERIHVSEVDANPKKLFDYQILALPGGFSYGDHIGSGRILAAFLKYKLGDTLQACAEKGQAMLGVCNGFQILVKLGLLPGGSLHAGQSMSLIHNDSGRYEDRWVRLKTVQSALTSPWLQGIDELECPVRHGEGKLVAESPEVFAKIEQAGHVAMKYVSRDVGADHASYPDNPNGSWHDAAGMVDKSGMIFGLMPHPEVALWKTQHPQWTRSGEAEGETNCMKLFRNIVSVF